MTGGEARWVAQGPGGGGISAKGERGEAGEEERKMEERQCGGEWEGQAERGRRHVAGG